MIVLSTQSIEIVLSSDARNQLSIKEAFVNCVIVTKQQTDMAYVLIIALVLFAGNFDICDTMSIQCTFQVGNFDSIGSIYYCRGTLVSGGSTDNVTAVSGSHKSGESNLDDLDVLGLNMPSQQTQYFPRNIEAFFPNIIVLSFYNNNITSISHDHLAPFPNLQFLYMGYNRLTSLDSNLFAGLNSVKVINFSGNNIMNIGHDFILPNTGRIDFGSNTCIDAYATAADEINALKFRLLVSCPPTINQIETTLESRPNLITKVNSEVQSLQQQNVEFTDEITAITDEMTDLQQSNVELTNRNSYLETRIGFLDTRAGYLEVRVAMLESIIERKLGLKIEEAISEKEINEM